MSKLSLIIVSHLSCDPKAGIIVIRQHCDFIRISAVHVELETARDQLAILFDQGHSESFFAVDEFVARESLRTKFALVNGVSSPVCNPYKLSVLNNEV